MENQGFLIINNTEFVYKGFLININEPTYSVGYNFNRALDSIIDSSRNKGFVCFECKVDIANKEYEQIREYTKHFINN